MKFSCAICIFLYPENLICRTTDISKCFRGSLQLRDNESRLYIHLYLFREYCSRFQNEETKLFCLRVMVGVIILYDHVHPVGAFAKTSGIDVSSVAISWLVSSRKNIIAFVIFY